MQAIYFLTNASTVYINDQYIDYIFRKRYYSVGKWGLSIHKVFGYYSKSSAKSIFNSIMR